MTAAMDVPRVRLVQESKEYQKKAGTREENYTA